MGKVASSTIARSIERTGRIPVFHVHVVNPKNLARMLADKTLVLQREDLVHLFARGAILQRWLFGAGHRARIITPVREPIGRNVSAFFQNLDDYCRLDNAHLKLSISELKDCFLSNYYHQEPSIWFEWEFSSVLGLDIFQYSFSYELGYSRIHTERFDILVLRHDLSDTIKARVVGEMLGLDSFQIIRENIGQAKDYGDVYRRFLKEVQLPREYVDLMLDSRYARHFYSPEERNRIRSRWLRI
jgi:hypothetical protein